MPPNGSSRTKQRRPPSARATYHHGALREALLTSALELIAEQGPDGFTLRELARRVGVNHRAVYRHFDSRQDVLAAIAQHGYERLAEALRRAVDAVDPRATRDRLAALGVAYVEFAFGAPAMFTVMFGRRLNEEGRYPGLEVPIAAAYTVLFEELDRARDAGRLAEGKRGDLALSFWAALHGVASLLLIRRIGVSKAKRRVYVRTLLDPVLRGLTT